MTRLTQFTVFSIHRTIHEKWVFFLAIVLVTLLATYWPEALIHLRYDRSGIINGEIWRVVTAHLVHLNTPHLFLNLFGLLLICELLWGEMPLLHGVGLLGFSSLTVSIALWWLNPELVWYAGLSGVLHGLWAGCVIYGLHFTSRQPRLPYLAGVCLLVAKLFLEFYFGPSQNTAHSIGGEVIAVSHLYGALAGAVYMLTLGCVRMRAPTRGALQQQ